MAIKLNNPLTLLSLGVLGIGVEVMHTKMEEAHHIDLEVGLVIWTWSHTWVF